MSITRLRPPLAKSQQDAAVGLRPSSAAGSGNDAGAAQAGGDRQDGKVLLRRLGPAPPSPNLHVDPAITTATKAMGIPRVNGMSLSRPRVREPDSTRRGRLRGRRPSCAVHDNHWR
jgi:hypothetical protein